MNEYFDVKLELLTPAFLSGADQKDVELRGASVRGVLRWWWRALVGHRYTKIDGLRMAEGALFGSTELGLKSPLGVRLVRDPLQTIARGRMAPSSGISYEFRRKDRTGRMDLVPYLGYGPIGPLAGKMKTRDGRALDLAFNDPQGRALPGPLFLRPALDAGNQFTLRLHSRTGALSEQQVEEVVRACCSWVTLGGLGARSRKGWGALEGFVESASSDALAGKARAWWNDQRTKMFRDGGALPPEPPPFPQLEFRQVFRDPQVYEDWKRVLGSVGKYYKEKVLSRQARWITGSANRRRASSVLLTLTREEGKHRGVICFLPCRKGAEESGAKDLGEFAERFKLLGSRP